MRIRKKARLLMLSPENIFQTTSPVHIVCKLNQSPWDVIHHHPYISTRKTSNSTSSSYQIIHAQLDDGGANILSGNGSIADSIPESESIASTKIEMNEKAEKSHEQNNSDDNSNMIQCTVTNPSYRKSDKLLPPRQRGRGPGKKTSKLNPNEFYYYSGFGPLWGQKRGGEEKRNVENNDNEMKEDEIAGVMEDGGGDGSDSGRKRGRKPVKARSLKSLM